MISNAGTVFFAIVAARGLGADQYGEYLLIIASIALTQQLLGSGTWLAITKYLPQYLTGTCKTKAAAIIRLSLVFESFRAALAMVILIFLSRSIAEFFFGSAAHQNHLLLLCPVILFSASQKINRAILRIINRYELLIYEAIFISFIQIFSAIFILSRGPTIESLLLYQVLSGIACSLLLTKFRKIAIRNSDLPPFRLTETGWNKLQGDRRRILRTMFFVNFSSTSRLTNRLHVFILGGFLSPASVGYFGIGQRITGVFQNLADSVSKVCTTEISNLVADDRKKELSNLLKVITRSGLIIVIPMCLFLTAILPWLIPALFGHEFIPAVIPAQVLCWGLLRIPFSWCSGYLNISGKEKQLAYFHWGKGILGLLILILMVFRWGTVGAAAAVVITDLAGMAFLCLLARECLSSSTSLRRTPRP